VIAAVAKDRIPFSPWILGPVRTRGSTTGGMG
jgi:hypothetical protein